MHPCEGRYAHSAPRFVLCTTRTSQSDNPNRRHSCGCPCNWAFPRPRKKSTWLAWSSCPSVTVAVTDAFLDLSQQPVDESSETLEKIERFIVVIYSRTCSASGVNDARKELYVQGSRTMENTPPSKAALLPHVRCATYQAGYVWSHCVPMLVQPP